MWLRATSRAAGPHRRTGPGCRLRRGRGDADRGVLQVPAGRRGRRTGGGGSAPHALVDRSRGGLRTVPVDEMTDRAHWRSAGGRPAPRSQACTSTAPPARGRASPSSTRPPQHARHEAEVGGYVAAEAAAPGARRGARGCRGADRDERFRRRLHHRLQPAHSTSLLSSWPGERTLSRACPASTDPTWQSWPPTGFRSARCPPTISVGSRSTTPPAMLAANPPALVHLTALASHRGVGPAAGRDRPGVPRARRTAGGRRGTGDWVTSTARSAPTAVYCVVTQVDGRPARRRRAGDSSGARAAAEAAAASAGVGLADTGDAEP